MNLEDFGFGYSCFGLNISFHELNYRGMDDQRNTKIHRGPSRIGAVVSDLLLDRSLLGIDL